jgi:phosphopantothenoylcysteine decarboxylase / phosphopantothenate---cysteine ligase
MANILLGVSGGIAAYRCLDLVRSLSKNKHNVSVVFTKNSLKFVRPLSFEALGATCYKHKLKQKHALDHINVAKKADLVVIVPATANTIAKLSTGTADDFLSTTFLATKAKKIIFPAMNTIMLENKQTKKNIKNLKKNNIKVMPTSTGLLACNTTGKGKLPDNKFILDVIESSLPHKKPLKNKKVLITAGPTEEKIDPVRVITNLSSGKMGIAFAQASRQLGAKVNLLNSFDYVSTYKIKAISFKSAQQLKNKTKKYYKKADYLFMIAAVSDFAPIKKAKNKIKTKNSFNLKLKQTSDILKSLKSKKKIVKIGFALESKKLIKHALAKLKSKDLDFIIANKISNLKSDTGKITIISRNKSKKFKGNKKHIALKAIKYIAKNHTKKS